MLTIRLNGREEKINIGCRTFISLDDLLRILDVRGEQATVNGETIRQHDYPRTTIRGGETLVVG